MWIFEKYFTTTDGKEIEITYDFRKDGVTIPGLIIKQIKNEKVFTVGDKITLDINEFNGISYNCLTFVLELFKHLPTGT